jgi:hypothetical protein
MTVGALVLSWFQPTNSAEASSSRRQLMIIRNGVVDEQAQDQMQDRWHAILIQGQLHGTQTPSAHIVVERNGKWSLTDDWSSQKPLGDPGIVRVLLRDVSQGSDMDPAQREGVVQLIHSLEDLCRISREHVFISDSIESTQPVATAMR